jgi:type III restriction enzyme
VTRPPLTIQFDPNQDHQLDAIRAVTDLFEGWDRANTALRLTGDEIVSNLPLDIVAFDPSWLLSNLQAVQQQRGIPTSPAVTKEFAFELEGVSVSNDTCEYPSFTVEMETGTGKTYVYLRTIHELRKLYGFRKFVVVVPSVAIYEGVAKTFQITERHFRSLYGNEPVHLMRYDGSRLSTLREFATSSFSEILLITLDSFNKKNNVVYQPSENLPGERLPYQFIQETRPILILDEPQNMESSLARAALATLHPLFALRYSATHRTSPNLVCRLTPFEAFRQNLVKRIQVVGVTEMEDANRPFLAVTKISKDGAIRATIRTLVQERGIAREKEFSIKDGDNLQEKTGRHEHRGYVIREIHRGERWVEFENNLRVREGEALGHNKPEVFRAQIRETIRRHMDAQERLREKGIKVLSLFFIDRVANYTAEDAIIRTIFDREFKRLRIDYPHFTELEPSAVREAYFASRKKGKTDGLEAVDIAIEDDKQKKEEREAARRAFALIMKDKERLLSFDEPVSFIFAHSALKEGWDNPNVFQICTLNQTTSETKKRQEIGRGLRLAVDQRGERVTGDDVNVLTVVANQSYHAYAEQLQREYVEEGLAGDAPPPPSDAARKVAIRNELLYAQNPHFKDLWRRLAKRLRYDLEVDTNTIVARSVERLNESPFPEPKIVVQRGDYVMYNYQLKLISVIREQAKIELRMENTQGKEWSSTRTYSNGEDLSKVHADERLRGFVVLEVAEGTNARVAFHNKVVLLPNQSKDFSSAAGQQPREQARLTPGTRHRVFNVIDRAQRETRVTRATLNRIFRELSADVQRKIFANPEGWAGRFITTVRECVADLVAESLTFRVDGSQDVDLDELFPKEKRFVQKELMEAGDTGLYDLVQKDSGVEQVFIEKLRDDRKVELYFKFPPAFKVGLPKVIGNYNPDWGIIRRSEDGKVTLHLVRETKGTEDVARLRFSHEKRKIVCAKKYFEKADIDYRVVSEKTPEWWKSVDNVDEQLRLASD